MKKDDTYRSQFRLPYELYEKLKEESEKNHRSMNAEIVARLQESFKAENTFISSIEKPELTEEMRRELLASMIAEMVEERLLKQLEEREKSKKA